MMAAECSEEYFERVLQNRFDALNPMIEKLAGMRLLGMADRRATLGGGILDRLVHNAHRIEMRRFDAQESLKGECVTSGLRVTRQ